MPQWVFLSHLFERVLLADRIAMGASGTSTKTSKLRRVLLITASAICLILATGWTVSYFKNRGLESDVKQAATGQRDRFESRREQRGLARIPARTRKLREDPLGAQRV